MLEKDFGGFKYPRSVRRVLGRLEARSITFNPWDTSEEEVARIERDKQYLRSRGIPQSRIDDSSVPIGELVYTNKPNTWDMEPSDRVMFLAILDAAKSGKTIVIDDIEATVRSGYKPNSPDIEPLSPNPGYKI